MNSGLIFDLKRYAINDGPGIRMTIFMKGCPLNCAWCHNPESIAGEPQTQWIGSKCIGCRTCIETCVNQVLTLSETGMVINRDLCMACGDCVESCPSTAMELLGKIWDLQQLLDEIIKDKVYFDKSDGGITLSGGEPALQPHFAAELLKKLKEKGIQTALDTCGLCSKSALEMLLPYSTMVLFDIKEIDSKKHERLTGFGNEKILENLLAITEFMKANVHPKTLWIRTPIIPGATDTEENIRGIGEFIARNLGRTVHRWELCTFNNLCQDKYLRLGMNWAFGDDQLVKEESIEQLTRVAKQSGVDPDIVHWSGSTRLEKETAVASV